MKKIDYKEYSVGNRELLKRQKTAFLCSRKIPSSILLKTYDWVLDRRDSQKCIISGFHSPIEKEMLTYFLRGSSPVILAMARSMPKDFNDDRIKKALSSEKMLIVSPFTENITRATEDTAKIRNQFIVDISNELFVPFVNKDGLLYDFILSLLKTDFPVYTINVNENDELIKAGAIAV
ncbi:MAG: DNA-binding protein [Spirochaetia bacterium]|nr:DNA-binding protein [Spirochaetia bacterium]